MAGAATREQPGTRAGSLEQQRLRAGLSLEQIADRTKISIRFLRAIESGDFEQLPAGIFATSYIRQYAGAIGADPEKILTRYRAVCCSAEETPAQESPQRSGRRLGWWFRALGLLRPR